MADGRRPSSWRLVDATRAAWRGLIAPLLLGDGRRRRVCRAPALPHRRCTLPRLTACGSHRRILHQDTRNVAVSRLAGEAAGAVGERRLRHLRLLELEDRP